jgi:hypothetical protein
MIRPLANAILIGYLGCALAVTGALFFVAVVGARR